MLQEIAKQSRRGSLGFSGSLDNLNRFLLLLAQRTPIRLGLCAFEDQWNFLISAAASRKVRTALPRPSPNDCISWGAVGA